MNEILEIKKEEIIEPEPGIYPDISNDDYHHAPEYENFISSSGVRKLLRSPAHFQAHKRLNPEPSPQMKFGTAAHYHVLEPDKEMVVVAPMARTSRKAFGEFEAEHPDKSVVSTDEMRDLEGMRKAMSRHSLARSLLFKGEAEQSLFWIDQMFADVKCKARPDYKLDDILTLVDYKTTTDARLDKFTKTTIDLGYDVQACWYLNGIRELTDHHEWQFVFIAQEKEDPYAIEIHLVHSTLLEDAQKKINMALTGYFFSCLENNWRAYEEKMNVLMPPSWASRAIDDEYDKFTEKVQNSNNEQLIEILNLKKGA